MNCGLGPLEEHMGDFGHWVFEHCPYHGMIKEEIERCSFCDENGEYRAFIECDASMHSDERG